MNPTFDRAFHLLAVALCGVLLWAAAPFDASASSTPIVVAQASPGLEERVRASASRMGTYRAMLADPDPNVRLAAMDEMTRSPDAAVREMAFDAGMASAEPAVRALALRGRLVVAKTLVFELLNTRNLPPDEWAKLYRGDFGSERLEVSQLVVNPATGEVAARFVAGRLAGLELQLANTTGNRLVIRVRLGDGNVMTGDCTVRNSTLPCRLAVQ